MAWWVLGPLSHGRCRDVKMSSDSIWRLLLAYRCSLGVRNLWRTRSSATSTLLSCALFCTHRYIQSNVAAAESHGTADLRDWERQAAQALERSHAAAAERIQPRPASPSSGSDSPGRRRSSPLRRTKKSKKSKDRKKDRRKRDKVGRDAAKADLFAALRAERLERESFESQRARDLVLAQTRSHQGYNNTYGYGRRRRA